MPFVLPLLNSAVSGVCLFESATDFTSKNILTLFWQTLDSWFNQSENFFFWYSSRSKCEVKPLCDDLSWSVVERFLGAISIFCRGDSLASPKTLSLWWHWLMSRDISSRSFGQCSKLLGCLLVVLITETVAGNPFHCFYVGIVDTVCGALVQVSSVPIFL